MRRRLGLLAAMENEEIQRQEEGQEESGADNLETHLAEVVEAGAEGDAEVAQVEEAAETSEALESLVLAMEAAVQSGGYDRHGAAIVQMHADSLLARVGGSTASRRMPGLESFAGQSSKLGATQLALESVKSALADIWKAIKEALQKAADWFMGYWNKYFGAAEKLKERAEKLEKRAAETKGKAKESTFENEGIAKVLHIAGSVDNAKGAAEEVLTIVKDLFAKRGETLKGGDDLIDMLDEAGTKTKDLQTAVDTMVYRKSQLANIDMKEYVGDVPGTGSIVDGLPGGKVLISFIPTDADKLGRAVSELRSKAGKSPTIKNKFRTLATGDAESLAAVVASIGDELISFRNQSKKGGELIKKLKGKIDQVGKAFEKEDDEATKAGLKIAKGLCPAFPRLVEQPYVAFSTYALQVGKASLDYVEESLAQYKED